MTLTTISLPRKAAGRPIGALSLLLVFVFWAKCRAAPAIPPASVPWRLYEKCGNTSSLVVDDKSNCVWFTAEGKVGKIDLATDKVSFLTEPPALPGLGARRLSLEGDRLWIGGHQGIRLDDKEAGGLGLYDIPSESLLYYRVSNTRHGDRPGLPSNNLLEVLAQTDQIWTYSSQWGLARFRWREKEPVSRWTAYSVADTESRKGAKDGILYDSVEFMAPFRDRYLLFYEMPVYQEFDPAVKTFKTWQLLPVEEVTASNLRGEKGQITWDPTELVARTRCLAVEGTRIWFLGKFASPRMPKTWSYGSFPVGGGTTCYRAPGLVVYDLSDRSYLFLNTRSTESRPDAADGLLLDHVDQTRFDGAPPKSATICVDEDNVWVCAGILCRLNRRTHEITQYPPNLGCGFPERAHVGQMIATGQYVWMASTLGVLRYTKSNHTPKVSASQPKDAQRDFNPADPISVTFDLPVNPATVRGESVELFVGGALYAGSVKFDARANRVLYIVRKRLPSDIECELVIKSLVQGISGNPVNGTRVRFVTAH